MNSFVGSVNLEEPSTALGTFPDGRATVPSQTAQTDDGAVTVIAEARLDHRSDLLALNLNGASRHASDAALILQAYQRWGVECVQHLLGDFAVVIWDRAKQRLFGARDSLGIKPLYYAHQPGRRFVWAFELEAMLAVGGVTRRAHEAMIADWLMGDFRDPEATFFAGINQLRPAHTLCLEHGILRGARYWAPDPRAVIRCPREKDYLDRFRALFCDAVRCRLEPSSPVGVMLSGGIDSVSVAAMAETVRERDSALSAFTVSDDVLRDERDAIHRLMQRFGTTVHELRPLTDDGAPAPFDWFISQTATPYYHGLQTHPRIFETVAQQRRRTLLTGIGGDELLGVGLGEDGMLSDLLRTGRLLRFRGELRRLAWTIRSTERAVLSAVLRTQVPPRVRWMANAVSGRQVPPWIAPAFAKRQHLARRLPQRSAALFPMRHQEQTWQALTNPAFVLALNQLHEASSAFGIECRHPFLDRRLIEFVLAVPSDVLRRFGQRKGFLQEALKDVVPGGVRPRYDDDSIAPDPSTTQTRALEVRRLARLLGPPEAPIFHYVDAGHMARLTEAYVEGHLDFRSVLWKCASLAQWLQTFGSEASTRMSQSERTRETAPADALPAMERNP